MFLTVLKLFDDACQFLNTDWKHDLSFIVDYEKTTFNFASITLPQMYCL